MEKFLIIQTAFIGDVVLATVLIEKLHTEFPNVQIDFLLRKGNEGLLKNHPYINKLLVWNKRDNKTRNLFKLVHNIRKNRYDKVINVQRFFSTGLITAFSKAKESIGFDKNPLSFLFDIKVKHVIGTKENPVHEVQRNLSLVAHFTTDEPASIKLYPSKKDVEKAKAIISSASVNGSQPFTQYICVAPTSVWFTKQYPKEKWIAFLQQVPANITIFFLGAAGDILFCDEIMNTLQNQPSVNLCGTLSFLQSAALMKHALMNYANDSAPTHIASAMNAPVTTVFCSTVTWFGYTPLSNVHFVVEKEEPLYCRPCSLHGKKYCPETHFRCAMDIKTEQLTATLKND